MNSKQLTKGGLQRDLSEDLLGFFGVLAGNGNSVVLHLIAVHVLLALFVEEALDIRVVELDLDLARFFGGIRVIDLYPKIIQGGAVLRPLGFDLGRSFPATARPGRKIKVRHQTTYNNEESQKTDHVSFHHGTLYFIK